MNSKQVCPLEAIFIVQKRCNIFVYKALKDFTGRNRSNGLLADNLDRCDSKGHRLCDF